MIDLIPKFVLRFDKSIIESAIVITVEDSICSIKKKMGNHFHVNEN
jgi:hypothetical protein